MTNTNLIERVDEPQLSSANTKRAYAVREDAEGQTVVVFATSGVAARRLGAEQLDLQFEEVDSCVRSPEFDAYAVSGKVPPLVLIKHGWQYECDHCGSILGFDTEGPDGFVVGPVSDGNNVYCNDAHLMAAWREQRSLRDRMNAVVEACSLKFFGWPIFDLRGHEHYQLGGRETISCCDFDFPGRKGMRVRWDLGDESVWISECDKEAWQALKASIGHIAEGL